MTPTIWIKFVTGDGWWLKRDDDERHFLDWPADSEPRRRKAEADRLAPPGPTPEGWTPIDEHGRIG